MGENHADLPACVEWYKKYDKTLNIEVSAARRWLEVLEQENNMKLPIKIKKLNIPPFDESDPKTVFKMEGHF